MSDIIQLLPDAIANQIAAGEVVQRPASALKELMENSVDAGATDIQVVVKEAGKMLIQVIDNGKGMSLTDARMCFERHATSKIRSSEDLFAIRTFGFRGEAMASIAAVAQVELKTRTADEELGSMICIEGSEVKKQEPVVCQVGTSIAVKNLFFNVPARRNFLKSNPVEMKHIVEEFQRVALSYPEVCFSLMHNEMELYKLGAGKLSQRVVGMFGKNYQSQLVYCEEDSPHVKIKGYVGKPENAKKSRGEQYFFVNNRYIKSNYLHHAVANAYEGLMSADQHPFYVLFLEIDPSHIDINVHPTKTEIKFDDERTIYSVVRAGVKQALGAHNVVPTLDFSMDVNFSENWKNDLAKQEEVGRENSYKTFTSPLYKKKDTSEWERMFEGVDSSVDDLRASAMRAATDSDANSDPDTETLTFSSKANEVEREPTLHNWVEPSPAEKASKGSTFQVELSYIVTQLGTGLLLIDQQASHERILYERYIRQLQNSGGASQQCLFPQSIDLSMADYTLAVGLHEELSRLGFVIEEFGKNTLLIKGVPADVSINNEKALFEGLLEQFKHFKSELSLDTKENLARSLAKKSSIKRGLKLNSQEMETLVGQLFACQNPNYGLSGNKTFVKLDLNRIQSFFDK
ncbi:DNA mismatch repair protein MutL [Echinicola pacifica]|uniref:DNA mismatch repair protein MutL n=1 Tax=Echinicola pacifica TaxID=346377 RepID=A0A918UN04_9BACT|nr:DNA mismatch repair endonuclease MutL [Echinicola pacifica]GGZ22214.1 DNA mismatch repair protein MutL [Echinicola pacifica]